MHTRVSRVSHAWQMRETRVCLLETNAFTQELHTLILSPGLHTELHAFVSRAKGFYTSSFKQQWQTPVHTETNVVHMFVTHVCYCICRDGNESLETFTPTCIYVLVELRLAFKITVLLMTLAPTCMCIIAVETSYIGIEQV